MPTDDIVAMIERQAGLRRKEVLTEEQFSSKKADPLPRL
jgi:hypothetical protein